MFFFVAVDPKFVVLGEDDARAVLVGFAGEQPQLADASLNVHLVYVLATHHQTLQQQVLEKCLEVQTIHRRADVSAK